MADRFREGSRGSLRGATGRSLDFPSSAMGNFWTVSHGEVTYLIPQLHASFTSPFRLPIIFSGAFYPTYDRPPFSHVD